MPEKERTRLEIEQEWIPGGLSERALRGLVENSKMMGWTSLAEDSMRNALVPVLQGQILPQLRRSQGPESVKTAMRIARTRGFNRERPTPFWRPEEQKYFEQIQLAIIQYEANKIILDNGTRIPFNQLRPYTIHLGEVLIRVGKTVPPQYAPIPDMRIHKLLIPIVANTPERLNIKGLSEKDKQGIRDNVHVLNVLFGTRTLTPMS